MRSESSSFSIPLVGRGSDHRAGQRVGTCSAARSRTRPAIWIPLLTAFALIGAGCSDTNQIATAQSGERGEATATDDPSAPGAGELDWSTCTEGTAALAELECATLSVPIDRADPEGGTLDLALARVPASGAEQDRIGALLFNPGGPGGSGIEFLANASLAFPQELGERFDLVSWDPRGVGASTPVHCASDEEKDASMEGDLSPDNDEEMQRAIDDSAQFRDGCESNNPDLIEHMSTADVAGDMEEIRIALGEEKLNFVGFSYGTAIGATYATLFPESVRAMVLDGSVSPTATAEEDLAAGVAGFERTYGNFVEACDNDPDCALAGSTAETIDQVRRSLDANPITVQTESGAREFNRDLFDIGLLTAMYQSELWGSVADAIANLEDGGAELILSLTDQQTGRQPDGTWDNSTDAQTMVNCADEDERPDIDEAIAEGRRATADAPTFGEILATGTIGCVDWPLAANPVPEWTAAGAPPILVIGTVGDPATPYEWSEQMADALEGSVLLTYEGDGHTAFMRSGACVEDAVVGYLVDLDLPAEGTSCPVEESTGPGMSDVEDLLMDELTNAGIPTEVAQCIVDRLTEELGDSGLGDLLLGDDPDGLAGTVNRIAQECAAGN